MFILCFLVITKTRLSFEPKDGLTAVMAPSLTPLDVLCSATSQRVETSQLQQYEWVMLDEGCTLPIGHRAVHGIVDYKRDAGSYPNLSVKLSIT